jgi:hypothetical protein
MPAGNSLLSTVFVQDLDPATTVKVNYYDFGPGDGTLAGERVDLEGHTLITTAPISNRRIISRLVNKPRLEIIVTGGQAVLGIHIGVVSDFPQEPELLDGQIADFTSDKGSPLMILGSDDKWYAWRGDNGVGSVTSKPSGLSNSGKISEIVIDDISWTPLPASALTNRNSLSIQNLSGTEIKLNYDPLTVGYVGIKMGNLAERHYDITSNITIYAKSYPGSGSRTIVIEELS